MSGHVRGNKRLLKQAGSGRLSCGLARYCQTQQGAGHCAWKHDRSPTPRAQRRFRRPPHALGIGIAEEARMADAQPPPPPSVALRTYGFLRLGMVAVIVALAVSVVAEIGRSDGCVQRSISAYYYTPTRSVFVGALVTLGLCMIALWGKTPVEDSFLNLAGMLAPVVAFVPTADANFCSIVTSNGTDLTEAAQKSDSAENAAQGRTDQLITAAHDAVFNNVATLIFIIMAILLILFVVALVRQWTQLSFWIPYMAALLVWAVGAYMFWKERPWFYEHAHMWSAILLFAFIIVVVLGNAFDGTEGSWWRRPFDRMEGSSWRLAYLALGALMVVAAIVISSVGATRETGTWFGDHWVFMIESTLISLFGVFWVLQTIDRRKMGAPAD